MGIFLSVVYYMDVSKNRGGPPKSSILIGFSSINHPFWWFSPYCWKHPNPQHPGGGHYRKISGPKMQLEKVSIIAIVC